MTSFAQAWRSLLRRRTFTLTTILTLAAGIAVTTTMFSIVNGVLLRPLPFPDGGQLVSVYEASPGHRERVSLIAPARLEDWNRLDRTFAAISGSYAENVTDTSGAEPERLDGRRVMPRYFQVFGMAPSAGRTFVADEERYGGSTAAVISDAFWARRFGRNPSAVGARLTIAGTGYTIVGVMPRAFTSATTDIWIPAQLSPGLFKYREDRFLSGVGRMKTGVTLDEARRDLAGVQAVLGMQYPGTDKDWSVDVLDLKATRIGDYRRPLLLVFGAVALLFAISVANIAGLVLVQLQRRTSEFAIRAAIGASRRQIVGAVMREVAIVAVAGGACGAAWSMWMTQAAIAAFSTIPRMAETRVDARALAFVALASAAAAAIFGLIPAVVVSRARISTLLSSAGRGASSGPHGLQGAFVIAQFALGVVLAGSAGLLVRSYDAMTRVDGGYDATHVVTFHVGAAWDEDRIRVGQLQERLLAGLQQLPGVRAAGYANFLPASGATLRSQITIEGLTSDESSGAFTVGQRTVTPGYLKALSVPLVAGQWCADVRADFGTRQVRDAMLNRKFVERFAPGQNLIGRRLTFGQLGNASFQIAGIVGDVREDAPASPVVPYVYTCLAAGSWPDPEYVVRADGDPPAMAGAIRRLVKSLDRSRPVFGVKPLAGVVEAALDQPRLNAAVLGTFAAAALVLAALGLYGLLMLLVAQRRRELGVRIALGASPADLVELVFAGAGRLVAAGIAVGLVLTLGAGYLLRSVLFGVAPYDPRALVGSALALALVALAAIAIPARQAARLSAMEAMKI
jgi:putative ABC transport system permease protein